MEFTAEQLAQLIGGEIEGNSETKVSSLSKIEEGKPGSVSFLYNPEYANYLYVSRASVIIVNSDFEPAKAIPEGLTLIRVPDSRAAFAKLLEAYQQMKTAKRGIHPTAIIDDEVEIGDDAYIGAYVEIGKGTRIGNNAHIKSGVKIGDNVTIGDNCMIHFNVVIADECIIGNHCTIQPGAIIGGDGFGFQPNSENNYAKIPHIGNVILEDHVEIGANTTIDRATMGSTVIKKGVKLDNLIQIGHNVIIDENTVIAAQSGVAGSTYIGKNCMIGGQVGFAGHQKIADGSKFAAKTGILGDIKTPDGVYQGIPYMNYRDFQRSFIHYKNLPSIVNELNQLKKELEYLKKEKNNH